MTEQQKRTLLQRDRFLVLLFAAGLLALGAPAQSVHAQEREMAEVLDSLLSVRIHSAAQHAQTQADAPAAVTVITAEEIAAFGARTLAEVLARVPGFHISYDHNYTYLGVRGFGRPTDYNNRTLILLDGHPLNEGVYGSVAVGTDLGIDVNALQRIEIVRGPVSALYGGNAMIAVINLVPRSSKEPGAAASLEGGTQDYFRAAARGAARLGPVAVFASAFGGREDGSELHFVEFEDGTTGSGVVRGRDWDRFAGGFASATAGAFGLQVRATSRTKAVPTGAWFTDPLDARNETTDRWIMLGASYTRPIGVRTELSLLTSFLDYHYEGTYVWSEDVLHDVTDNQRRHALVQVRFDPTPAQRLLFGASISDHSRATYVSIYENAEDDSLDLPFRVLSAFGQAELHLLPELTLTVGGRIDAEDDQDTRVTPRAALVGRPHPGTAIKLLYGSAFRPANAYERSYPTASARATGGLRAERLRTAEVVLEQQVGRGAVRVSAFAGRFEDLIDTELEPETEMTLYENVGSAGTRGIEAEVTAPLGTWLLRTGGSVLRGRDGAGLPLTNAPARIGVIGVSGPLALRLSAAAQLRTESSRIALDGSRAAAHALVDTNLTWRPTAALRAGLRTTNLLDVAYSYPGGAEHPQVLLPQEGRRLSLRLEYLR